MKCIMFESSITLSSSAENVTMTAQNYVQDVLLGVTFLNLIVAFRTLLFPSNY